MPALINAMKHDEPSTRSAAADSLGNIGPAAIDAVAGLKVLLTDKEDYMRRAAESALKKIQVEK